MRMRQSELEYSLLESSRGKIEESFPQRKLSLVRNGVSNRETITNEDPVLNSAAARLGQAMKETQDVLQRDNLEATASLINCVGGANGRSLVAVLKSDVMGLELLAA